MNQLLQGVYASIGQLLLAGGGGAVVAYSIFYFVGKRWLEQQFAKQLERFKHEQQKEIELLRHTINSLFSRISKIHEKEFEVLPTAWKLLHEYNGAVFQIARATREYPDLDRMSEPEIAEFLKSWRLRDFQKEELRNASDKLKYYRDAIFWVELGDAKRAQAEFNNFLVENSIFFTKDLRTQFREIHIALGSVIIAEEILHGPGCYAPALAITVTEKIDTITGMFNGIEAEVQKRLRYDEA